MAEKERNLGSLVAEFHDQGKANSGLEVLNDHLNNGQLAKLSRLLDHHNNHADGYRGKELTQRFEIDSLIEFYCLLLVAVAAGYIPAKWDDNLKAEVKKVLGADAVKPYYQKHYPYKLASYALQSCVSFKPGFDKYASDNDSIIFNSFAALNRDIKKDKDIERFIGMLDYVWYGEYNLDSVIEALNSKEKLVASFTRKEKKEIDRGILGFVKYANFLSLLRNLIESADSNPLLQSAMWMYHGYFLDRMNDRMLSVFEKAFDNIQSELAKPAVMMSFLNALDMSAGQLPDEEEKLLITNSVIQAVNDTRQDVLTVLDPKWGKAVKEFFGDNGI